MKDTAEVIRDFNNVVNMTAAELEKWLKSDASKDAGWSKDDGGESIGHDSGRKIVQILRDNPQKNPDKYTDDHIEHMRRVVSYCKRHLAQEEKINDTKTPEEVKKTKSYASLKNWGHDPLKGSGDGEDEGDGEGAGAKRAKGGQDGQNKRQKTGTSTKNADESEGQSSVDQDADEEKEVEEQAEDENEESAYEEDEGKRNSKAGKKTSNGKEGNKTSPEKDSHAGEPKKGDTVSWNWGQGQPEGKVEDVKHQKTSIETKKGNTVSRDGTSEDPVVVVDTGKSKAVKLAHELN